MSLLSLNERKNVRTPMMDKGLLLRQRRFTQYRKQRKTHTHTQKKRFLRFLSRTPTIESVLEPIRDIT